MTIHRFAVNTGQDNPGKFSSVLPSMRTDVQQRHTPIAIHDEESADIRLARSLADEMIDVSGAEIQLYIRTDNADNDNVWDEDADPTYWNSISIKAFFKPAPLEIELKKWGVDLENNRTEVVFSHRHLYEEFGKRMLRVGDVLHLPYNAASINPEYYRVVNATPSGNFRYIWLYLTCQVEVLTADITVRPKEDMPVEERFDSYLESL